MDGGAGVRVERRSTRHPTVSPANPEDSPTPRHSPYFSIWQWSLHCDPYFPGFSVVKEAVLLLAALCLFAARTPHAPTRAGAPLYRASAEALAALVDEGADPERCKHLLACLGTLAMCPFNDMLARCIVSSTAVSVCLGPPLLSARCRALSSHHVAEGDFSAGDLCRAHLLGNVLVKGALSLAFSLAAFGLALTTTGLSVSDFPPHALLFWALGTCLASAVAVAHCCLWQCLPLRGSVKAPLVFLFLTLPYLVVAMQRRESGALDAGPFFPYFTSVPYPAPDSPMAGSGSDSGSGFGSDSGSGSEVFGFSGIADLVWAGVRESAPLARTLLQYHPCFVPVYVHLYLEAYTQCLPNPFPSTLHTFSALLQCIGPYPNTAPGTPPNTPPNTDNAPSKLEILLADVLSEWNNLPPVSEHRETTTHTAQTLANCLTAKPVPSPLGLAGLLLRHELLVPLLMGAFALASHHFCPDFTR
ncbi:hypothetical protein NEDG_01240 [Nematocida displodere]|uniref:Uncharacterized protein n=1 Tax=Nematocida displodere TaxID=1805483 RepID=A0A177EC63_9MICR|nr:hypothetical protein NEDG_01240 [Nematocida displodere]